MIGEREKVIDRILKLRALADPARGGYDGERAVASSKAAQLMAKHSITEADIAVRQAAGDHDWFRRFWQSHAAGSRSRPSYTYSAADIARRADIDPVRFRRWLRREGVTGVERDRIFGNAQQREELIERYRRWADPAYAYRARKREREDREAAAEAQRGIG